MGGFFIKPSNERGLSDDDASKLGVQSSMTHVHGSRESLHGDGCVVGMFALAYLE